MYKVLNIFFIILILIFFFSIYNYYFSSKNIKIKDFNRNNINEIINDKTSDLPILANDTNNVIVFNDSFYEEINNDKLRSFWDLLKTE